MRGPRLCAILGLVAAALFAGCEDLGPPAGADGLKAVEPVSNLEAFVADEELVANLREQFVFSVHPVSVSWSIIPPGLIMPPMPFLPATFDGVVTLTANFAATAGVDADGAGGGYSTTNIQEQGVDESDVVKTDGTRLYVAKGSEVKIALAVPADAMAILGTIPVRGRVDSMYLYRSDGPGNGKGGGPKHDRLEPCADLLVVLYRHNSYYGGPAVSGCGSCQ